MAVISTQLPSLLLWLAFRQVAATSTQLSVVAWLRLLFRQVIFDGSTVSSSRLIEQVSEVRG
ncbi:hypothetical protein [Actinomadura craniellae]|uniref:hypothetical protein n=1 Tax=Actinomadura craniellae TaxID=2231787 RepID=UPI001F2D9D0D